MVKLFCFCIFGAQPGPRATVKRLIGHFAFSLLVFAGFSFPLASLLAQTPVPVLTWRYDLTHAGQNTSETALTPGNVNATGFGKLFSHNVDGQVFAQPLYVPGLTMSDGNVHNVFFVATENDSLYAFDADSNGGANANPIWHVTLLDAAHGAGAGATAIPWNETGIAPQGDIGPVIGITGTPAIDPATNTMYVVSNSDESGVFFSRLHAINIINGAEQTSPVVQTSPVAITATVAGTGTGSSGGQLTFSPLTHNQRPALDLYNGYVYIGYAAHGDIGPWHGWLFAYNATTMQQSAVICLSPNKAGGGVWASGAGLPIDEDGPGGAARMFVVTGNGKEAPSYPPFTAGQDFSESIIDFSLANGGLTPTDAFSSFNADTLNNEDWDQGSGGILMVPDQQGPNPHILIQSGKEGRLLVLDRDNLGGNNSGGSSNPGALQEITNQMTPGDGLWSTPAYWNGNVYIWPNKNVPMIFTLTDGVLSTTPSSKAPASLFNSPITFPEPSFSISSNGTNDGIAWAVLSDQFSTGGPEILYAWPANDLTTPLYTSNMNATRDKAGHANKFSVPVVTNGKVYVAADGVVSVYGLLNGVTTAATPVIAPNGGTFTSPQTVSITSATSSAQIYYTLDGSTPTTASTQYSDPITISTNTSVNAIASAAGYLQSAVASAVFSFSNQTPSVSFTPAAGTYSAAQQVTISDPDPNAQIYFTTDGSTPSASSTQYTGPITVAISETVNAIAIDPSLMNSNVASAAYVITAGGETFNFAGFATTTGLTLNGTTIASNDTRLQLTDGGLNQAGSVFWNTPINIQAFTTQFTFQLSLAQANGFTFTIQNNGATALGGNSAGLGYQGIGNSVAVKFNFYNYENEGNDSTGVYTNGEAPVANSVDISPSGIELNSDDGITATITYDGTTLTLTLVDGVTGNTFTTSQAINIPQVIGSNTAYVGFTGGTGGLSASQKLTSWMYTTQALPPAFSPAAGTFTAAQNVTLNSRTTDAVIYYTTDGSTPTAASNVYSGPIPVAASETISAIAISPTMGTSMIETAEYVIQIATPAASFSLSASSASSIPQGGATISTVTVTPANGFTGSVTLACSVTSSPAGAVDIPTCSASQPGSITGSSAVTSTVTINTQAGTTAGSYTATVTGTSGTLTETAAVALTVDALGSSPAFTLSGLPVSIASPGSNGTSTITVTPSGGFTGTVALTCAVTSSPAGAVDLPTCTASQPGTITGTGAVTSTVTINTQAGTTVGSYAATVTGSSGNFTETVAVALTVNAAILSPAFTLSSAPVSIASPGASATSTITVTPSGGFTGTVALSCAVTSSPAGAVDLPTCLLTQPSPISGTGAVTSTLTINTTAASTAALHNPIDGLFKFGGGGALVALLLFGLPDRRRKWQSLLGLLLLLVIAYSAMGCGGTASPPAQNTGTTAGNYVVSVTGTSGTAQATTAVTVAVE